MALVTDPKPGPALLSRPPQPSSLGDGAVVERLAQMRGACQALATELAATRRRLRAAEAELQRLGARNG